MENANYFAITASKKDILITLKIHWHYICHENDNISQPAGLAELLHSCVLVCSFLNQGLIHMFGSFFQIFQGW